jgi:hypothetical protein
MGRAKAPDYGIRGLSDIRNHVGQDGPTGHPGHHGLAPAARWPIGSMGIEPPAAQGIPGIDVRGFHPLPEQPVAGLYDGPEIAELIDRASDRDRSPK